MNRLALLVLAVILAAIVFAAGATISRLDHLGPVDPTPAGLVNEDTSP